MKRCCLIDWYKLSMHDLQACSAIIVCVIGIGALSMAYAFAQAGPVYGSIGFVLMCGLNIYATILLSKVQMSAPSYVETYSDLGFYVGGIWGRRAVEGSQLFTCLLVPIAFLILGGASLLPGIFRDVWNPSASVWIILMSVSLLPFALIQNLKEAFWVMILGTTTAFVAIVGSVGQTTVQKPWDSYEATEVSLYNVLPVFGNFALAYGASIIVPTVQRNHPDPTRIPMNVVISMLLVSLIYIVIAVLGYAQFGCAAPSNMLLSMEENGWKIVIFICMQIHVMISFAVIANPVLFVIERLVLGKSSNNHKDYSEQISPVDESVTTEDALGNDPFELSYSKHSRSSVLSTRTGELSIEAKLKSSASRRTLKDRIKSYALRTTIVAVQTFLALLGQSSFSDIASFIGATTLTICCMILPCAFYYKLFRSKMSFVHKVFCLMVIVVSTFLGVYTAYKKLKDIINVASSYKLFALAETKSERSFQFCPAGYQNRHPNI